MPDVDVTDHVKRIQRAVGADPDGWPGLRTAEAVETRLAALGGTSTIPAPPPPRPDESQPPTLRDGSSGQHRAVRPLGEMALQWCLQEAGAWGANQVSVERVKDYLRGCSRDGETGTGTWLANTYDPNNPDRRWSFCIAAQGFAEDRAGGNLHSPMPPWRAGVFEAERDAADGKRPGEQWVPVSRVWDAATNRLLMLPPPGSLVIYGNRNAPGKGHAERLIRADADGICSVGANENNRRWVVDHTPIPWTKLERADGSQVLYLRGFIVAV
jgi:hypothetical protein